MGIYSASPVCILRCMANVPGVLNVFGQSGHLCLILCAKSAGTVCVLTRTLVVAPGVTGCTPGFACMA